MEKKENIGGECARNRIDALLAKIGDQLSDILTIKESGDVDAIVAEQEKSEFIFNQAKLVEAYRDRYEQTVIEADDQITALNSKIEALEAQNAELEEKLKSSKSSENYCREKWYNEEKITKELKAALKHLSAVLAAE